MIKNKMRITFALFIGIVIGSAMDAFAAIGEIVEAQFAKFTIIVDGREQMLDADPLVVQGSAYVPLRAFANMVGLDVVYKSDSRTIELNTPTASSVEVNNSMAVEFSQYPPEIINSQIIAMEEILKTETDPDTIIRLKKAIEDRTEYLTQIGYEFKNLEVDEIEKELLQIEYSIKSAEDMIKNNPDNETIKQSMKKAISELKAKKSELEARKAELEAELEAKLKELEEEQVE